MVPLQKAPRAGCSSVELPFVGFWKALYRVIRKFFPIYPPNNPAWSLSLSRSSLKPNSTHVRHRTIQRPIWYLIASFVFKINLCVS